MTREPGFQVPFARELHRQSGIATMAVGLIRTPEHANAVIADGDADLVALGREHLWNPNWAAQAAVQLGAIRTGERGRGSSAGGCAGATAARQGRAPASPDAAADARARRVNGLQCRSSPNARLPATLAVYETKTIEMPAIDGCFVRCA